MWSDRTPPERLRALVTGLRSVLPAPSPEASSTAQDLRGRASFEQLAELLHTKPSFTCLNRTYLLHAPLATVSYSGGSGVVSGPAGTVTLEAKGFELLEAMLAAWRGPSTAILAGFLAYDLAAEIEDLGALPREDFDVPKFYFGLFDSALVFNDTGWRLLSTDAWRKPPSPAAAEDLIRLAHTIFPDAPNSIASSGPLSSRPDQSSFEASVDRIVATIHAGDIFQTNLCRRIETQLEPGTEWSLFRRMQSINPASYEAFISIDPGHSVLSISPEMFLKVEDRIVESSPIKGTRPRACTPEADRTLSTELLASEKDRAELAMIVDVVRNDLARVCQAGSVKVVRHAELMTLPTVHHLFSTVKGRLREEAGVVDLLRAAFPAASITGAPKIEAMRVALREEGQLRGPCMGAIGWISLNGRLELSVAIRTAFVAHGQVRYYAGCGITADSIPPTEFEESRHKAAAFVRALGREDDPGW